MSDQPMRRRPDLPTHQLEVISAHDIHPGMRRVIFKAPAFDHLPGQDLAFLFDVGLEMPARRHYTIRDRDADGNLLVDIILHGQTVGPQFARNASPGQLVTVRGPRGRSHLRDGMDWHLLVADETGLPAALHMVETRAPGSRLHLILEVQDDSWVVELPQDVDVTWVLRGELPPGPSRLLLDQLAAFALPEGQGFAVLMAETSNVRALRHHLIARGLDKSAIASEGYWRPGREGGHDHVDD